MPVYLRYGGYVVFFWTNENGEPVHFHVAMGSPTAAATKIWVLSDGSFLVANNAGKIPDRILRRIFRIMQDNLDGFMAQWRIVHGEPRFYR